MKSKTFQRKKVVIPNRDNRIRLNSNPDSLDRFWALCNKLERSPGDTVEYLLDVEEISTSHGINEKAEKIGESISKFLTELKTIDARAYEMILNKFRFYGVHINGNPNGNEN